VAAKVTQFPTSPGSVIKKKGMLKTREEEALRLPERGVPNRGNIGAAV